MGYGAAGLTLQAGGTLMSTMAAGAQAQGQKNVLNYEAGVAANNAVIAGEMAQQAKVVGAKQTQASEINTANVGSAQRTTMAANGIDMGKSATATDLIASTTYMGQRDVNTIQDNTNKQVWADTNQQTNFTNEANSDRAMASSINPTSAMMGSLLTGAGSFASSWYRLNPAGSFRSPQGAGGD